MANSRPASTLLMFLLLAMMLDGPGLVVVAVDSPVADNDRPDGAVAAVVAAEAWGPRLESSMSADMRAAAACAHWFGQTFHTISRVSRWLSAAVQDGCFHGGGGVAGLPVGDVVNKR